MTGDNPRPRPLSHPALFQPTPFEIEPEAVRANRGIAGPERTKTRYALNTASATTSDATALAGKPEASKRNPDVIAETGNSLFDMDNAALGLHRKLMRATRSDSPLRILITRRSQQDKVRQAQNLLASLGYDPGPADGLIGKQSATAFKRFQEAEGLQKTGYPNSEFYATLYRKVGIENGDPAYIYVRQNAQDIFSAQIKLHDPMAPLGAHFFLLASFDQSNGEANWNATTVRSGWATRRAAKQGAKDRRETPATKMTAGKVLDRIVLPDHVRQKIEDLLTPESSLIISDGGHTRETGQDTDFVVVTR